MSARNYLSAREKNTNKIIDCLPVINQQKFNYRTSQDLPVLSANSNFVINRNINYSYEAQPYMLDTIERAGTPFSDFFSDSETGTPDIRSEESDSSSGSALRRNTAEASQVLADEWEKIERTIYNEDGQKVTRPQQVEECKQWRELHPQLRIIGKGIPLPEKKLSYRQIDHEEIIAIHYSNHYSDGEFFSETEERQSESSTDCTPQNSPRASVIDAFLEPKFSREKVSHYSSYNESDLPDSFCSLLQITPIQIKSPVMRKRQNSSILKSEISSSKWMRNSLPDSAVVCNRNSAKSYLSLDTRNGNKLVLSASDRNKMFNNRVLTAKHRELTKLQPLYTPELIRNNTHDEKYTNSISNYNNRKVSLPPLLLEEEKKKIDSAKRPIGMKMRRCFNASKCFYQLDKRHN